ncbi:MAG: hypothetical protein Q7K39_01530 [Candidatus Magasanikbacteria bacterium]|nr:hypothetical protein [Candidatus Magasanikbacteria bacterium]
MNLFSKKIILPVAYSLTFFAAFSLNSQCAEMGCFITYWFMSFVSLPWSFITNWLGAFHIIPYGGFYDMADYYLGMYLLNLIIFFSVGVWLDKVEKA